MNIRKWYLKHQQAFETERVRRAVRIALAVNTTILALGFVVLLACAGFEQPRKVGLGLGISLGVAVSIAVTIWAIRRISV